MLRHDRLHNSAYSFSVYFFRGGTQIAATSTSFFSYICIPTRRFHAVHSETDVGCRCEAGHILQTAQRPVQRLPDDWHDRHL